LAVKGEGWDGWIIQIDNS
jgi:hypothetical protein